MLLLFRARRLINYEDVCILLVPPLQDYLFLGYRLVNCIVQRDRPQRIQLVYNLHNEWMSPGIHLDFHNVDSANISHPDQEFFHLLVAEENLSRRYVDRILVQSLRFLVL